ncbi:MAG: hypothetical protein R2749_19525 [Acidimicrobiales bacterium]
MGDEQGLDALDLIADGRIALVVNLAAGQAAPTAPTSATPPASTARRW